MTTTTPSLEPAEVVGLVGIRGGTLCVIEHGAKDIAIIPVPVELLPYLAAYADVGAVIVGNLGVLTDWAVVLSTSGAVYCRAAGRAATWEATSLRDTVFRTLTSGVETRAYGAIRGAR